MVESRCGILCSECEYKKSMNCAGCANIGNPFWGDCSVKKCCEDKKQEHCGNCGSFVCNNLNNFSYDAEHGDNGKRIEQCKSWKKVI